MTQRRHRALPVRLASLCHLLASHCGGMPSGVDGTPRSTSPPARCDPDTPLIQPREPESSEWPAAAQTRETWGQGHETQRERYGALPALRAGAGKPDAAIAGGRQRKALWCNRCPQCRHRPKRRGKSFGGQTRCESCSDGGASASGRAPGEADLPSSTSRE